MGTIQIKAKITKRTDFKNGTILRLSNKGHEIYVTVDDNTVTERPMHTGVEVYCEYEVMERNNENVYYRALSVIPV